MQMPDSQYHIAYTTSDGDAVDLTAARQGSGFDAARVNEFAPVFEGSSDASGMTFGSDTVVFNSGGTAVKRTSISHPETVEDVPAATLDDNFITEPGHDEMRLVGTSGDSYPAAILSASVSPDGTKILEKDGIRSVGSDTAAPFKPGCNGLRNSTVLGWSPAGEVVLIGDNGAALVPLDANGAPTGCKDLLALQNRTIDYGAVLSPFRDELRFQSGGDEWYSIPVPDGGEPSDSQPAWWIPDPQGDPFFVFSTTN
ncbi:MAG: hypothetical protein JWM34_479 [Ilumatobacteraceae bacterium]|nr:hypothetical protein [Ilumatobacteraceae bacterium]